MISQFLSLLSILIFVPLVEPQLSPMMEMSPHENVSTTILTPQQTPSTVTGEDSTQTRLLNKDKPSQQTKVQPQSYYSPQDAFFRLFNPFVFPSSPGLTCVGVACNQNNVDGASGVETCAGGNCNQNNARRKRTPEAQFGGFGIMENFKDFSKNFESGNLGGFQKCVGSQCNQNNLEGLFQKQKCLGSQCNQKNDVVSGGKLFTPLDSIGSLASLDGFNKNFQFGTKQNCIGSQCNQNNLKVAGQEQNCQGSDCNQNNKGSLGLINFSQPGTFGSIGNPSFGNEMLFGQKQNCIGSKCNQNNLEGLHQKQKCIGSQCNQNNVEGLGQKQQCLGSQCNQNNLEGLGQAQTCLGSQCNQNSVG